MCVFCVLDITTPVGGQVYKYSHRQVPELTLTIPGWGLGPFIMSRHTLGHRGGLCGHWRQGHSWCWVGWSGDSPESGGVTTGRWHLEGDRAGGLASSAAFPLSPPVTLLSSFHHCIPVACTASISVTGPPGLMPTARPFGDTGGRVAGENESAFCWEELRSGRGDELPEQPSHPCS